MKILYDTSVLVPGLSDAHPDHGTASAWLDKAARGQVQLVVSCHNLAELYATLTGLPLRSRILPHSVLQMIETIIAIAEIVPLTPTDYRAVLAKMTELGLSGGIIYDGLIARAAEKAKVDKLLTFNVGHFRRVWPEGANRIIRP